MDIIEGLIIGDTLNHTVFSLPLCSLRFSKNYRHVCYVQVEISYKFQHD